MERIMTGQEFKEDAGLPEHTWGNNGDSDHSSPDNGVSEGNQPSPVSTLSSRWAVAVGVQTITSKVKGRRTDRETPLTE